MELNAENLEAYRMARWQVKCATIATALAEGWPLGCDSSCADSQEYRSRLEEARAALAEFPAEWANLLEVSTVKSAAPAGLVALATIPNPTGTISPSGPTALGR